MRGQFYILSVVLISAIVTATVILLVTGPRAEVMLKGDDFLVYWAERSAEDAVRTAVAYASSTGDISKINETILNFTQESQAFAKRSRISLKWDYTLFAENESNVTVDYTLWIQREKTTITDVFSITKGIGLSSSAYYLPGRTLFLNVTVYNEDGPENALTNANFVILVDGVLSDFNIVFYANGLYTGSYDTKLTGKTTPVQITVTDPRGIVSIDTLIIERGPPGPPGGGGPP